MIYLIVCACGYTTPDDGIGRASDDAHDELCEIADSQFVTPPGVFAQATPVLNAIYPEPGAPWPGPAPQRWASVANLDDFYVNAQAGVDFETGEVIDKRRFLANQRDEARYAYPSTLAIPF